MAHCVLAQWVIVTKFISQYLKIILLIQDKDKKAQWDLCYIAWDASIMEQPGIHQESIVNSFQHFVF